MSSLEHPTALVDERAPLVAPNVWMRKTRRTGTFAALAYVNAVVWVAMAVDAATKPQYNGDAGNLAAMLVFLLGVAALSVIAGRRLARCGLWMSRERVIVNGPLRTWTLPVSEVEDFEPGVRSAGNGTPCPVLRRSHGRPIGIWALGRDGLVSSYSSYLNELQPLCEELTELARTLQAAPQAVGAPHVAGAPQLTAK
ncbi:MAG TPA: hypothetical protein VED41_09165 [Solirubrobacteraceae bacterium]|nr:hypothetical protein [Solirubrobacteraceae bacterium]